MLSQRINFTIDLILTDEEKWGMLHLNGSSTGAVKMIMNKKADFAIGKFALTVVRNKFMTPTFSYYSSPLIIVVPYGKLLTSLERLLKPFRRFVWLFVLVTCFLGVVFIVFVRHKCKKDVQDFVLGSKNTSPLFNMFVVLLGGSLVKLPRRNFARTLLSMFLLYCLVIRNSYTGALFTFIRSDNIRKPSLNSIDEMFDQNFTFYMVATAAELTKAFPKIHQRRTIIRAEIVPRIRNKMTDPEFQGGLLSSLDQIVYFNAINHKNFTINVSSEKLSTFHYAIYFEKESPFVHNFDLEILEYRANGLINNFVDKFVQLRYMKRLNVRKAPKALCFSQVMGSFKILIFGLSLSSVVAVLELLSKRIQSLDIFVNL